MSASQTLGGSSRAGKVLGPSLDKIIKNVAWRKHAQLVSACKSAIDKLETIADSSDSDSSSSPLLGFQQSDAEFVIQPLVLALGSGSPKVVEPALECCFKLFSMGLIRCQIDKGNGGCLIIWQLIEAVCKSGSPGEDGIEIGVLRVLLAAVRSRSVLIRGDCLIYIVRTSYNLYLGSLSGTNQICAKAVLAQIMIIVFTRVEADSMDVDFRTVMVADLLEFTDRNLNEGSSIHFTQNFISEVMDSSEGVSDPKFLSSPLSSQQNGNHVGEGQDGEGGKGDSDSVNGGVDSSGESKLREDGFQLFKNLCKLSMKFSTQEHSDDQILLRGKILSLELLKVIMDNGGPVWRNNERFLGVIKQYLCLSLLKNSALSVMTIFQLLSSIFTSLLSKFRSGLKAEIGIFFPMLILRVLENVLQPSFLQKMTILSLLEKISQDSQLVIDIFVNYDCDVDAPNIFERIVNGLLKTAMGPPSGSTTTLSPIQDLTFRLESVKCLVSIMKSMGFWLNQQLRIGDTGTPRLSENDSSSEYLASRSSEDGSTVDLELQNEASSESFDASTLEQRRAYKLELQKGIKLFNTKPSKGIQFLINTKKVGSAPEEVALFLKNTNGLSETVIGDYLGEREEFSLKVMHAYVDGFDFENMDFGEAIRFFLRGFRLPGEAQKIDRIMEKFAERYCKCNPNSFTSADTAYVLAYSVIMLNTDAHNTMVKDKMSKADFIRNNRGIDDGKDLPEEYLGALYDQIVRNEIRMKGDSSAPQSKQVNSLNKLLGLDGILNLVTGKQAEEKPMGANGVLIRHIQEQFRAKSGKSESIYYQVADPAIIRFMVEVCWGPMLAAFSVTLDQSDDRIATSQCLLGFRYAVHVTAVIGMQTQRDAFVTTVAKFTLLHSVADMKQKNVDAVKAMMSIAIEDGNYLQEAWEHVLTCLSRFEHLQLLGEGAPSDASFFSKYSSNLESDERAQKSPGYPTIKKKGTLQNPAVAAAVRGGSYDSTTSGVNTSGLVSPEQVNNFILNLNLLDQIGTFELNHIFAHSQRLNSEAIVAFVRALCKVSMQELQSPTDPRVFSLTKIVEITHYNMNRIRLVWSRIWSVLSDFFVSVGLSENLSVSIFVMDSLRQLSMKFLEREELANYNFQNEFLRPFVIVMQKSSSAEIRELIVRCISQMVLSRVSNVKSGWKSVFMVFTTAAADERKNIVLLAFETMEKIVREYFPYITETETVTFTDCVRCLITFTNSRFNSDVSLNAIAFLRFCAVKLADGGLVCNEEAKDSYFVAAEDASNVQNIANKDDHVSFWIPLLSGLSNLTSDPRSAIRKSALEVLFNILKDHGHQFSRSFWNSILNEVVLPIFHGVSGDPQTTDAQFSSTPNSTHRDGSTWDSETTSVAVQCLLDLFFSFFNLVRSHLPDIVSVLAGFIRSPVQGPSSTGVAALLRLAGELGDKFTEDEWKGMFLSLKEAAASTLPGFLKVLRIMENIEVSQSQTYVDIDMMPDHQSHSDEIDSDDLHTAAYVISRTKSHIAMQLLIIQVVLDLYKMHHRSLSAAHVAILLEICSSIATHANQLNSESVLQMKLKKACSILELSGPPVVHFEIESHQNYLKLLQNILSSSPSVAEEMKMEAQLVSICQKIIQIYLDCAGIHSKTQPRLHMILPLGSAKKEELTARTPLIVSALGALSGLERDSFRKYLPQFFPLLVDLVRSEHSSGEVQRALSGMFLSCIGPLIS
uniref:SEC7 domain-containing protein n=1 Tax=Kalanchoe fedtschenkoi TaxID=63787 RepID=A0A7N0U6G7_KALFE